MQSTPLLTRQLWGCGWEPPPPNRLPVLPAGLPGDGPTLTVCPGYSCGLPEVIETTYARQWKKDGELAVWLEGATVTPGLKRAITELECEYGRAQTWDMRNPKKGG